MKSILDFFKKNSLILAVSSFISLTIGFFGPSQIFFTNPREFSFTFKEVLPYFLITSLISFLIISIILFILNKIKNKKYFKIGISLVFILGFLLWLQGNVIVWDYGIFDGKPIPWEKFTYRNWIDDTIWMTLILLTIFKFDFFLKIGKKVGTFLIIVQLIYIFVLGFKQPMIPSFKKHTINESNKFTFSKNKNVVILLLDTLQTDIFFEVLAEKNEYKKIFDGFNYYPDTLSGYPYTFLSIPSIFTGKYHKNEEPTLNYIKNSFMQNSLLKSLKENGFKTEVYTEDPITIFFDKKLIDNIVPKKNAFFNAKLLNGVFYLADITLFRLLPNNLKEYMYNDQKWRISNNNKGNVSNKVGQFGLKSIDFVKKLSQNTNVKETGPVFKFYHLRATHLPYELTEDLKIKEFPPNIDGYKEQVRAMLTLTKLFLNKLKEIGVFDNSLIIIMADHGVGIQIDDLLLKIENDLDGKNFSGPNIVDKKIISRALPLLLIKPINSIGELKDIKISASSTDVPRTVLDYLGIKNSFPGINLLKKNINTSDRIRTFYYYDVKDEDVWENDYITSLDEYKVNGFSGNSLSWSPTNIKYLPEGKKIKILATKYNLGQIISFGKNGISKNYELSGWGGPEDGYNWTNDPTATLRLALTDLPKKDLTLKTKFAPLFPQRVLIYVNKNEVGEWFAQESGEYKMTIPKNLIDKKEFYLSFVLPEATKSPKELGIGEDIRKLGIAINYLELR
ncbi:hypothetical protein COV87_00770 [Candidatus Roizmanbacteria bacterium CG11_big_fil_rev_8_21_14_0_20_37_16]|uniref:Sulfatase N-terminal domain-containing protein n=1 Tax=Candidatus Roizmanbacteria bacterium CG11_big_fil_rev_8_21_14_0_20_37_16 TaxID=1974857 RepID=A0A2H0KKZ5_9BACT|nr:MAG: hypothetical protein COV87_00770 [Candidatus Roizmanbacteria bacterium CG11_big_fil_rev_8_21_14_0_20_37_16]